MLGGVKASPMNNETKENSVTDANPDGRPSWPYPVILLLYVIIYLLAPTVGTIVGLVLFFCLQAVCLWGATSRNQYEKMKKTYSTLSRPEYFFNMIIFPVVVPLLIFIALIISKNSVFGR